MSDTLPVKAPSLSLYEIEDELLALIDTADVVPDDQREEFARDFGQALLRAVDKREAVHRWLSHLESQIALGKSEVQRIKDRVQALENLHDRMEDYVVRIIKSREPDAKGRYPKLEAHTVTLAARACPASVEITNEEAVPSEFKIAEVRLPLHMWEMAVQITSSARARFLDQVPRITISKSLIKTAIESGEDVPGARLVPSGENHTLVRR